MVVPPHAGLAGSPAFDEPGFAKPETAATLQQALHALDAEMADVQLRSRDVFDLAHAWAERHDAILARTPPALREDTEQALRAIRVRWGVVPGARITAAFPAIDV